MFELLWSDDLRQPYFIEKKEYFNSRRLIFLHSERLSDLLEYGRSRLRICRGWAFNSIFIAVSLNTFLWSNFSSRSSVVMFSLVGTLFALLFGFAAWYSWKRLVNNEYLKIKEQAEFRTLNHTVMEAETVVNPKSLKNKKGNDNG
jgi:hypothetical protein